MRKEDDRLLGGVSLSLAVGSHHSCPAVNDRDTAHRWGLGQMHMEPLVDPREGDIEDDASSTESRSFLALAGSVLAEISFPKLAMALLLLVVLPAVLLGLAVPLATVWIATFESAPLTYGIWALAFLAGLVALGWFGGKRLLRVVESSFWSLNALAVQPTYAAFREVLLHLVERTLPSDASDVRRGRLRAATAAASGLLICVLALWVAALVWPSTRWVGQVADLRFPGRLALVGMANSVVLMAGYLAVASLVWGASDALMPQARDIHEFKTRLDGGRTWRVAHLSDVHVVGERYGFRLGSGRSGPRGNERLWNTLARLDALDREHPLDAILITGDLTDAGTSAEWAELLDGMARYPRLADRVVALPGNHDLNVVDRSNPARLDLPTSPKKRLREVRTISALAALQGTRTRVVDGDSHRLGDTLADALKPYADDLAAFADEGSRRLSARVAHLWTAVFPMVLPPAAEDGLGIIALNSNAETHFSFTNALGLVSLDQSRAVTDAIATYPRARWIVALHHHIVEYPKPVKSIAQRIGCALINGSVFTRRMQRFADQLVVMHGHRHIDWIGQCGSLQIVSAPSPMMEEVGKHTETYFYVHTLGTSSDGRLTLLQPERIDVPAADANSASS